MIWNTRNNGELTTVLRRATITGPIQRSSILHAPNHHLLAWSARCTFSLGPCFQWWHRTCPTDLEGNGLCSFRCSGSASVCFLFNCRRIWPTWSSSISSLVFALRDASRYRPRTWMNWFLKKIELSWPRCSTPVTHSLWFSKSSTTRLIETAIHCTGSCLAPPSYWSWWLRSYQKVPNFFMLVANSMKREPAWNILPK